MSRFIWIYGSHVYFHTFVFCNISILVKSFWVVKVFRDYGVLNCFEESFRFFGLGFGVSGLLCVGGVWVGGAL